MVNIILCILVIFIYIALGYSFPRASIAFLVILLNINTSYKSAIAFGTLIGLILRDVMEDDIIENKK